MGLLDIYKYEIYRNYANFQGRTKRAAFWWFTLSFYLLLLGSVALLMVLFPQDQGGLGIFGTVLVLGFFVLLLGMMIPLYAITIRRLHDAGLSGWWVLLNFVPILGLALIFLLLLPSRPGGERYGTYVRYGEDGVAQEYSRATTN
ncbi:DUF805 domain-containing protein [Acidithiobacillus sp.]|uniref:DUF805 domain-containing protein n=1 Tax=Acidithiobacillus sp. TaxID=1872118 RepID=UPI0025C68DE7|nr:DUF805 domain-containing protein [Acidithiobacillus sp.]